MIHRYKKTANYAITDTHSSRNPLLTIAAKGLHNYLMQLPDDYKINIKGLVAASADGKTAITTAMNMLINHGYVFREKKRTSGHWDGFDYHVFEQPSHCLDFTVTRFSVNGKTEDGKTVYGKSATINNLSNKGLEQLKEREKEIEIEVENQYPPTPPAGKRLPTVQENTELCMRWVQENAATVKFWYDTAGAQDWKAEKLKSEIALFFSFYMRDAGPFHAVNERPINFFTKGFYGWVAGCVQRERENAVRPTKQGQKQPSSAPSNSFSRDKMSF